MKISTQTHPVRQMHPMAWLKQFTPVLMQLIVLISIQGLAHAQQTNGSCGSLQNGYGPYDYRSNPEKLQIVYKYHFTPIVETLIRGATGGAPGADIDYTLRAAPNQARALLAMMRLGEKEKTQQPRGSKYTIDYWFERALRFRPDDNVARMIYATYLAKNSQTEQATAQLNRVVATAEDNPFTHYNAGLVYFDLKDYDKSLMQAHKAMALGWPRTELVDKLKAVGKWNEPAAETPASQPEQK